MTPLPRFSESDSYMTNIPEPRVERTPFEPIHPPDVWWVYLCPACGRQIRGSYNIEPARKRCTKTWHLTHAVRVQYVRADGEQART